MTSSPRQASLRPRGKLPTWLKIAYTVWFVAWVATYWRDVGPVNFLWLCDVGNFVLLVSLWTESRALISATAVGVILIQLLWVVDVAGRLALGFHLIGGTEYMFDPTEPVGVRFLSMYHFWVPLLLIWTVRRLGFDRRAWKIQTLICWMVLPLSFLADPELNLNWLWKPFGVEQSFLPPSLYLVACLVLYPLVLFLPSQLVIERWVAPPRVD